MSLYEIVVFVHVVSVVVWVGGGVMMQVLFSRFARLGPQASAQFATVAESLSNRLFMPASIATLVFGIWAVLIGPWSFGDLWITLGLTGYILSALLGMTVLGPSAKRLATVAADRGPDDPVAGHMRRRLNLVGRIDLLIVIAVIFDMVVKPGT